MADLSSLLIDRPDEGRFAVNREAFISEQVFALEQQRIFEGTWVYVGHESQIPQPHDFITTQIGRHPILVSRDAEGQVHCLINSCRHRGMLLTPERCGRQRMHMCRYHGWAYDSAGNNKLVAQEHDGLYPVQFQAKDQGLVRVAHFGIHNGFMFASLNEDVPSLTEHLGGAAYFLDLITLQGADGIEFVPGSVAYTFEGNWKLQIENALDMYHFGYVHLSYLDLLRQRAQGAMSTPAPDAQQGSLGFGRGHALMWRTNNRASPAQMAQRASDFAPRMDASQQQWCTRGMNFTIFPNLQIVDNITSVMLRTIHPLSVSRTEMQTHCVAPRGEDPQARAARIRDYEEFFNPSGLATPDDNVIYEHCQAGLPAVQAGETAGYLRGMDRSNLPATNPLQSQLGPLGAQEWIVGPRTMGDETCFHGAYREWARLLGQTG